MKAVRLLEYGGQLVFDDVPTPTIARDEILVKIKSTAVNHLDLVEASGTARQILPIDLPWIPGHEFSGVVKEIGSDVAAWAPDDAVFGTGGMGAYAEHLAVKPATIVLGLAEGASLLVIANRRARLAFSEGQFVDLQSADLPLEVLARNAELRRRTERAGNPAVRLLERGFDQRLLTVGQGGHGRAVRRFARLVREPRLIDHERLAPPLTQHDGALDHVLELAHVARPVVGREPLQGLLLDIADGLPRLLCEAVDQVLDQDRNVVGAFAQRRQADGEDVQPIEQILPEPAALHRGLEIAVARREHTHVHHNRMTAADALDLSLLEHTQQ